MDQAFRDKTARKAERLARVPARDLEREVAAKRMRWFDAHARDYRGLDRPTPRQAYEMLFFDYMGLEPDGVPVVSESDGEIVWRSLNPCPTLDACRLAGLDTRKVCRKVYEKSTQALVSRLDPGLRFLRSYEEIRPHADHCLERIVRVDFEAMMALALDEARLSRKEGNKGYGAVLALGNEVVAKTHDTASTEGDPTLHAELKAVRMGAKVLGSNDLSGAVLFATCEPCPMCASAAVWANVSAIVYGASIEETVRLGKQRITVGVREIVANSPAMVEVVGGVLAEECLGLYA